VANMFWCNHIGVEPPATTDRLAVVDYSAMNANKCYIYRVIEAAFLCEVQPLGKLRKPDKRDVSTWDLKNTCPWDISNNRLSNLNYLLAFI
jgi:hypothetical protein